MVEKSLVLLVWHLERAINLGLRVSDRPTRPWTALLLRIVPSDFYYNSPSADHISTS